MKNVRRDEKGFTLIETILVLSIVMVITSSIVYVTTSKLEETEERRFFRQFHLDMQRLQSIAIAESKYTHIYFDGNGTKYIGGLSDAPLFEYKLPKHMRLSFNSNLKRVSFHPNGTVSQFGTLYFETGTGHKTVTIYIGGGKVNYEE
ncbi:competence type IV pilus minor pilin ComGD [Psychrobacillus sp. NPDC096389]|uniref:competence type IV pilus minor pilin ComGD n=1 Tax=Psychrobacillus sp. NPDC096389 TaxID=3364490 RepID=UPI003828CB0A